MSATATTYEGNLYVYGEVGEDEGASARLFVYNPQTAVWKTLDASNIPLHSTMANCEEELLFIGGATYDTSNSLWETFADIKSFDPATGVIRDVGALAQDRAFASVAVYGSSLYVGQGDQYEDGWAYSLTSFEKVEGYQGSVLEDVFPDIEADQSMGSALVPVEKGIVLTGLLSADGTADTYLFDTVSPSRGAQVFTPFEKRVSHAKFFYPAAMAYEGYLYVLGTSYYEPGNLVFRATAITTLPQPGDIPEPTPTPTPTPNPDDGTGSPSTIPETGDSSHDMAALAMLFIVLSLAAGATGFSLLRKA